MTLTTLTLQAMTMPFTVQLVPPAATPLAPRQLATYRHQIQTALDQIDHDFSPFRPHSLVNRWASRQLTADQLTPDFQTVYAWAIRAADVTGGAFDPFYAGRYDPTGLVKGWAIQRVFERYLRPALDQGTLQAAAINGAGDIQVGVAQGSSFRWHVGIEDPTAPRRVLATYTLQNGAVATSGTHQHGEHIRRQVPSALQQATVVLPTLTPADIYATAAVAMGPARFLAFSHQHHLSGLLLATPHRVTTLEGGVAHDA